MNEESHWDRIATNYSNEIFDVFKSDRNKLLPHFFERHADKTHSAIDFGCGTGKAFPYLSPRFKSILALDISSKCLTIAKKNSFENISYKRMDLARRNLVLPQVDFVFCCNVIMLPEVSKNVIMIGNIAQLLRRNATALLVLPSLDSILFSTWRLINWYEQEGVPAEKIPASELAYFKGSKRSILQGIVHIDGVRTKHYSSSELSVLFRDAGLRITNLKKLEYDWSTEFASPPDWMAEPYPWDWLVECSRDN